MHKYTLTVTCRDQSGLIAAITSCISASGGNILNLAQHTSVDIGMFFCKANIAPAEENAFSEADFRSRFEQTAKQFDMEWQLFHYEKASRMAVLVSKTSHCLYEVLLKHQDGQLHCDIPLIISNHPDLCSVATEFHIPFFTVDTAKGKAAYEADLQSLLDDYHVDVVCLARYMQILSPEFTGKWKNRIINIHHGFLPAFKGAKPYHQAWNKGVKIIGATAHFANEDLDQGPIIYQDVVRVDDTKSINEFVQMGQDVERHVLVEGLKRYFSHSIFIHNGRTFIIE
ncbi:MAG: formyltetrahydrofolate deformylase [Bacteroides sp.]|nr:formyltetrahydrofolate deformylase [Prevotella sp.]MCM1408400.1 formyltetrahydrofolate deformylase [Treponema brennaborense]MCM1469438.1 formyltetrahydrofolate deformylase [Bacteroides sp.]